MSCRYKNECPSYSGWCEGPKQDFARCVQYLITAYESTRKLLEEYQRQGKNYNGCENKKEILQKLNTLLKATRAGSGIKDLALSGDERIVTIHFSQGSRSVNVEADSGCAMIMDIVKALL